IVTFCAMTLPSICAPSLIWRSEARTSPSIRPKICAGPLHSMLPTIDMSEPMQEAVPVFVVGSELAQVWSCCTTLPTTSAALIDPFLSYPGTPLFVLINMSTSSDIRVRCANRTNFDAATYHLLSAAALNSSRNRNFVHMKDASQRRRRLPCSRASPIPLVRASSPAWRRPVVAVVANDILSQATPGTTALQAVLRYKAINAELH